MASKTIEEHAWLATCPIAPPLSLFILVLLFGFCSRCGFRATRCFGGLALSGFVGGGFGFLRIVFLGTRFLRFVLWAFPLLIAFIIAVFGVIQRVLDAGFGSASCFAHP